MLQVGAVKMPMRKTVAEIADMLETTIGVSAILDLDGYQFQLLPEPAPAQTTIEGATE